MIKAIYDAGLSKAAYDLNFFLSILAASAFAAILARRVGLKRFRCAVAVVICWLVSFLCACTVRLIETDFKVFNCGYNIRCFIFIPLAALAASLILKQKYTRLCDLLAVSPVYSTDLQALAAFLPDAATVIR